MRKSNIAFLAFIAFTALLMAKVTMDTVKANEEPEHYSWDLGHNPQYDTEVIIIPAPCNCRGY